MANFVKFNSLILLLIFSSFCCAAMNVSIDDLHFIIDEKILNHEADFIYASNVNVASHLHIVGKCKISSIKGTSDNIITINWLGIQDKKQPNKIAKFDKKMNSNLMLHDLCSDQKIHTDVKNISQEIPRALHNLSANNVQKLSIPAPESKITKFVKKVVRSVTEKKSTFA